VPWQVGHQGADAAGGDLATFDEFQAAELRSRPDVDLELAAAGRIESRSHQVDFDVRPQPVYQRQIRLLQEINGGAIGLWVPPSRARFETPSATSSAGSSVWSTRVALPAVPMRKA